MKKCTSCTKDLPEAALHCVFCGAKQPPAPAVQSSMAKTAFGYSANEVMDQLRGPGSPPQSTAPYAQRGKPPSAPPAPAYQPPQQNYQQPYPPPPAPAAANAATVFAVNNPPPPQQQAYQPPPAYQQPPYQQPPYQQPPMGVGPMQGGMGINAPNPHTPPPLAPMAPSPYLAAQAQGPRPVEPWRDSLKLWMIVWGAVMLGVWATPVKTDPMIFNWTGLGDQPGKLLVLNLMIPAIGLLAVVIALIPMQTLPRGVLAAVLGFVGVFVPIVIMEGYKDWQLLLVIVGLISLFPGLLVRNEYTESLLARVLVTIGVLCTLLPLLIPEHGDIPLVGMFKMLIDAPGKAKVGPILELGEIFLVVMALLAWMPAPATGGAKIFAWAILLWGTAVRTIVTFLVAGNLGDHIKAAPSELVLWGTQAALVVLIGYGAATVIGKKLE